VSNIDNNNYKADYNTDSIATFLASIGKPFSYAFRKEVANNYGITNYSGKTVHNLQLLDLLKKQYRKHGSI